jgi:hypothetical protein
VSSPSTTKNGRGPHASPSSVISSSNLSRSAASRSSERRT